MILGSFLLKSFHFFSKYPKHALPRTFIRRDYYKYMNKPSMKWNESNLIQGKGDTRKTILTSLFIKIMAGRKK